MIVNTPALIAILRAEHGRARLRACDREQRCPPCVSR
jgi:hypothetical protein